MKDFNWNDIKIAYQVACLGSIQKAANYLDLNYTTVLRRINRLEKDLDCPLFLHHQRGYKLTDYGEKLLIIFPDIEKKFNHFSNFSEDEKEIKGILKITILSEYSCLIHPVLLQSQKKHPNLKLRLKVCDDVLPLESGQFHLSIRAGNMKNTSADLIAVKIKKLEYSYYASVDYIAARGVPLSVFDYKNHYWVMPSDHKKNLSFVKKIYSMLPADAVRYQSNFFLDIQSAIEHGLGIGPVDDSKAKLIPTLREIPIDYCLNDNSLWLVYHKSLKNDAKIKAIVNLFKEYVHNHTISERL